MQYSGGHPWNKRTATCANYLSLRGWVNFTPIPGAILLKELRKPMLFVDDAVINELIADKTPLTNDYSMLSYEEQV